MKGYKHVDLPLVIFCYLGLTQDRRSTASISYFRHKDCSKTTRTMTATATVTSVHLFFS